MVSSTTSPITAEAIIAVPVDKPHPFYKGVADYRELPKILIDQIERFFKDLELIKWVKVLRCLGGDKEMLYGRLQVEAN